ncbi:MAG TPA: hypothetical protein VFD74_06465, partial [Thermoleophilia bacterium]|nr:hypothetical protein [Thermoleophilia bacterium]
MKRPAPHLAVLTLALAVALLLTAGVADFGPRVAFAADQGRAPVWVTRVEGAVVPPLSAYLVRT